MSRGATPASTPPGDMLTSSQATTQQDLSWLMDKNECNNMMGKALIKKNDQWGYVNAVKKNRAPDMTYAFVLVFGMSDDGRPDTSIMQYNELQINDEVTVLEMGRPMAPGITVHEGEDRLVMNKPEFREGRLWGVSASIYFNNSRNATEVSLPMEHFLDTWWRKSTAIGDPMLTENQVEEADKTPAQDGPTTVDVSDFRYVTRVLVGLNLVSKDQADSKPLMIQVAPLETMLHEMIKLPDPNSWSLRDKLSHVNEKLKGASGTRLPDYLCLQRAGASLMSPVS